jgi:hypothetical protein
MIKLEPDVVTSEQLVNLLAGSGWIRSTQPVQFGSTMLLDLTLGEEGLLAAMKPKTRYNLRLAARHGVEVRAGTAQDFDRLYDMYAETSVRDGCHPPALLPAPGATSWPPVWPGPSSPRSPASRSQG